MVEMITASLANLPLFLAYFGTALAMTLIYVVIYTWVTPHEELRLIHRNNATASVAFAGSMVGFALPLASSIANSISLLDCVIWGLVALAVQLLTFIIVRLIMPQISARIEKDDMAAGVWLGTVSLTAGILNAASLTY